MSEALMGTNEIALKCIFGDKTVLYEHDLQVIKDRVKVALDAERLRAEEAEKKFIDAESGWKKCQDDYMAINNALQAKADSLEKEVARLKHGVHCQDFPHCRKEKHEPFYGVLPCGCTACDCKGE